jgi:hypothetical protein
MKINKYNKKTRKTRGGKTFSSDKPVKLNYNNKQILCDVCQSNNYTETTGAFGKSKVRTGVNSVFFGEAAEILDTTSVIIYTCNTCGLCKIIRNKDPLLIKAEPA